MLGNRRRRPAPEESVPWLLDPAPMPVDELRVERRPQHGPAADPWAPLVVDRPTVTFEPRPPLNRGYVPDTVADGWESDEVTVRLASVRGYSHRFGRAPRQDAVAARHHPASGSVVLAVADGVSSAPLSHEGAQRAVKVATAGLLEGLDSGGPLPWDRVVERVACSLEQLAVQRDPVERDASRVLGTTLVVAVLRPAAEGLAIEVAQAGDSGAWILDDTGRYRPVVRQKSADGITVVTSSVRALPQRPLDWVGTVDALAPGQVFLLGTDGFGDPLGDGAGLVGRLFAESLAAPPPPLRFAHLLDFSRETFDDDRTLVAVWPRARVRGRRAAARGE